MRGVGGSKMKVIKIPSMRAAVESAKKIVEASTTKIYEGKRKNQFCIHHIITKENPQGTDCAAHVHDARVFKCPYKSPAHRLTQKYPCSDYQENRDNLI
jgi:hypothetical protein